MNSVRLGGSIATDVTVRHYGDRRRATFLLRVERAEGRGVDFVPVVAWNAIADGCERLEKGDRAAVAGEIRSRRWQDEGRRRRAVEVAATSVRKVAVPDEVTTAS